MTIAVVKQTFPVVVQSQKPVIVNVGNVAPLPTDLAYTDRPNTFTADQSATAFVAPLVHGADVSVGDGGSITIRGGNSTAISSSAGQVIITGGSGDGDDGNVTINTVFIDPNGAVTATSFAGDGSALTNLTASNLSTGTAPTARLGSGTASSSTFLRGDQTWATVPVPTAANPNASVGTTPVIGVGSTFMRSDAAPAISQSIVPTWTGLHTFNGGVAGNGSGWTSLTATNLSSGTVPTARLGSGTASSTSYLRGDQTWQTTPTAANPTGSVGTTAVNGTATTFLRSDAAPPINLAMTPTWTGSHTFNQNTVINQGNINGVALTINRNATPGHDLFQCLSAGTEVFGVDPNGHTTIKGELGVGGPVGGAQLGVETLSAAVVGISVAGSVSQTANLQQWITRGGSILASVDASGNATFPTINAGDGSPLPFQVDTNGNVTLTIGTFATGTGANAFVADNTGNISGTLLNINNSATFYESLQIDGTNENIGFYNGGSAAGSIDWSGVPGGGNFVVAATGSWGFTDTVFLPNLPTSDPHLVGQLWNSSGTLKVSAG